MTDIDLPPGVTQPLIQAVNITKRFGGVVALKNASIDFFPGEVHCIAGENGCGKSTLMKVVSGAHRPTAGTIVIDGEEFTHLTPKQSFNHGIEIIYQDFSLLPNLSAAENIALPGLLAAGSRFVSRKSMLTTAEHAMSRLGIDIELQTPVEDLSVAERQLCAIARALAHNARLIGMDEPTTALTWREVDTLFDTVRKLRSEGTSIVFISHKMQEVFSISDRVSVMRNGEVLSSDLPGTFTPATLAEKMTGRTGKRLDRAQIQLSDKPPALEVENLTLDPLFADISFHITEGEIVGLSGLLGSGRTEIAEAIAGIRPAKTGTIKTGGRTVKINSLPAAIAAGIAYVPEDRLTKGLFLAQPIGDNLIATYLPRYTSHGLLKPKLIKKAQEQAVQNLRIKAGSLEDNVRTLSGGNAQRVLLAKWLLGDPQVLILNSPTVGVDVGSKFDILSVLNMESLRGLGVLIISDDVPELISICHRVLVVRSGRLVSEITGERMTEEAVVEAISA